MDSKVKNGFKKGFILFVLFFILTIIASTPEIENSSFSGIIWFFDVLVFFGAILLLATSWGAHIKSKAK